MKSLTPYNYPDYSNHPPAFPPTCASAWGKDLYGIWMELSLGGVAQRFRWVPRGEFTMGSPEDEPGRGYEESLHSVTLTQGFWVADSTVTQSLWQGVMGNNPANFQTSSQHPVEQVSWHDAQGFIKAVNRQLATQAADLVLGLPSEAQWEYACRAGTTTPFSFGWDISPEQVNYDGRYAYRGTADFKGLYRAKTMPVASLPPNSWGLYAMHGNVWEWCEDHWQEPLGSTVVADSLQLRISDQYSQYSHRVLRGGSWSNLPQPLCSANRSVNTPDNRFFNIGFRVVGDWRGGT